MTAITIVTIIKISTATITIPIKIIAFILTTVAMAGRVPMIGLYQVAHAGVVLNCTFAKRGGNGRKVYLEI